MTESTPAAAAGIAKPEGGRRWLIIALLFVATTVNYVDRTMLGLLAPSLGKEMGWSENDYGTIVTAFQAAYAMGFLVMGWLTLRQPETLPRAARRCQSGRWPPPDS